MIGYLETTYNDLLDIKAVIVKYTKYRDDYVGIMWEGIQMANNGAKKGVSLVLQAKEGLEKLKVRSSSDTSNIKAELSSERKAVERVDHERYAMANLQSQVDDLRTEMIKTDWLEMWDQDMEGATTPFLSILDNWMRKLEIGGGIMAGG